MLTALHGQVGIVDLDICGPSIPRLLGVEGQAVVNSQYGWTPLKWAEECLQKEYYVFVLLNTLISSGVNGPTLGQLTHWFVLLLLLIFVQVVFNFPDFPF